jgi:hypothetical protein
MNLRFVRASAWMRWRVLMNALERTGRRDRLERLSRALESLLPLIVALLLIPTAVVLGVVGLVAGRGLADAAQPGGALAFTMLRFILLAALGATAIAPFVLPIGQQGGTMLRLLLVPVERSMLFVGQIATGLSDPWIAVSVLPLALLPLGLLWPGTAAAALVAAVAGTLFLGVLLGLATLVSSLMQLVLRDRRRSELAALIVMVVLPLVMLAPAMLTRDADRAARRLARARNEPVAARQAPAPIRAALAVMPSELYVAAVSRAAGRRAGAPGLPLAALGVWMLAVVGLAYAAYVRLLEVPTGARRLAAASGAVNEARRLPGLSAAASAVALAQFRLVLRSPRGKTVLLAPVAMFLVFVVLGWRGAGRASVPLVRDSSGLALAIFGAVVMMASFSPITMNQFAIDRAGLTLTFLSPVSDRDLLRGKAVASGLVLVGPLALALLLPRLLMPGQPAGLWIALALGCVAAYLTLAPAAAALSALFPRSVDLQSIGSGSNPHQLANLLGLLALGISAAPPALLALLAVKGLGEPWLAAVFVLGWCAAAAALDALLFRLVAPLVAARRENLALVATAK